MNLTAIDWLIVVAYFGLSAGIGAVHGAAAKPRGYFSGRKCRGGWRRVGGRDDVRRRHAARRHRHRRGEWCRRQWLWWNMLMSGMLTVFFFARLATRERDDRREFAEIRYSVTAPLSSAAFARSTSRSINLIILGWVTRAMIKILTISLGLRDVQIAGMTVSGEVLAVGICFLVTMSCLWNQAVLWTDASSSSSVSRFTPCPPWVEWRRSGRSHGAFRKRDRGAVGSPVKFTGFGIEASRMRSGTRRLSSVQWWAAGIHDAQAGGYGAAIFSAKAGVTACSRRCSSRWRTTRFVRGHGSSRGWRR